MTKLEEFMKQHGHYLIAILQQYEISDFGHEADSSTLGTLRNLVAELHPVEWDVFPSYGDLLTLEDFTRDCNDESLIDYDGTGYFANESKISNIHVKPRQIRENRLATLTRQLIENNIFTHVMWFNR